MDIPFPEKYHAVAKYFDFYVGDLVESPLLTDEQRLLFYALRQQADRGPCTTPQPPMWYVTERLKHQAWQKVSKMSTFEAMVLFVQQFEQLLLTAGKGSAVREASPQAKVDWASRLAALKATLPPVTETATEALTRPIDVVSTLAHTSSSSSSPPSATPSVHLPSNSASPPQPQSAPADEMVGWDADVVAHASPSLDNVRYLAAELMRARRALRRTMTPATTTVVSAGLHAEEDRRLADKLPVPLPLFLADGLHTSGTPTAAAGPSTAPPLQLMWTADRTQKSMPVIPPPICFSARSLTEAAVRPTRKVLVAAPLTPVSGPQRAPRSASNS